jgi:GNAT superfamily N-acetyltransferase
VTESPHRFKRLSKDDDVSSFDCGNEVWQIEISNFLKENAYQEQEMGLNVTTLIYSESKLVAFFSLLASQIQLKDHAWRKRCGLDTVEYSSIPCILIGRFAIDKSMQRQGIGRQLTSWIRGSVLDLDVGVKFLTVHVDNNNDSGRAFWESEDFIVYDGIKSRGRLTMLYDLYSKTPKN